MVIIVGFATGNANALRILLSVSVPTMGVGIALISTNTLILHTLKNSTMKMGFGQAIGNFFTNGTSLYSSYFSSYSKENYWAWVLSMDIG